MSNPFHDYDDDDTDEKVEEYKPPVIHLFTEEQEERLGVGPSTEKPYNPDDFISKR